MMIDFNLLSSPDLYMYLGFFLVCLNVIFIYVDILHKQIIIYISLLLLAASPVIWDTQKGFVMLLALLFLQTVTRPGAKPVISEH